MEAPLEYALFLIGWVVWPLDALLRVLNAAMGPRPGRIRAEVTVLTRRSGDAAARASALACLRQADGLLRPMDIELRIVTLDTGPWPEEVPPPMCGLGALTGGFFAWASSRSSVAPSLTVYFVEDLGALAGCAVPGADWIVVELGTDGTTIVHEIGHLADLWRHTSDPDNVMTDRPGGRHEDVTSVQRAFLRTCRFVERPESLRL